MTEQAIDWAGIRAAAVLMGVREAARQAAQDLPPDEQERFVERVMKRSSREGWLVRKGQMSAMSAVVSAPSQGPLKPLSANVRTGAELALEAQAEYKQRGALAMTKAACIGAEDIAELPPAEMHAHVPALVGYATVLAKANPDQSQSGPLVSIQLLSVEHPGQTSTDAVEHAPVLELPE